MSSSIIALLSDLGTRDYFVGAIKGAILSVNPDAKIVDITHEVPKYDVRGAALILAQVMKAFPEGTIFVTIVDPGVGTERKCVLLKTKNDLFFISPTAPHRFGVDVCTPIPYLRSKRLSGWRNYQRCKTIENVKLIGEHDDY